MKNITPYLLVLFVATLFVSSAFKKVAETSDSSEKYNYFMKDGEVLAFGSEMRGANVTSVSTRGAYDGSRYKWTFEKGILNIEYAESARGPHQSEFYISHGYGDITKIGDTSLISCKSNFKKFYIFDVAKQYTVDSFSQAINVEMVTKSVIETPSLLLVSNFNSSLNAVAIPKDVKTKHIYKAVHKEKTLADFVHLVVEDSEGKRVSYPAGDYVVIGADQLKN